MHSCEQNKNYKTLQFIAFVELTPNVFVEIKFGHECRFVLPQHS